MISQDKLDTLRFFERFAPKFLTIRTKSGQALPFTLNRAQEYLHDKLEAQKEATGRVRAIILKGRQQGCSSYIQGRFFHQIVTKRGKKAFILTHDKEATKNLFSMAMRFYENLPEGFVPKADTANAKELYFKEFDSGYSVGTAGNKAVGRSQTIQLMHSSEVAFWAFAEEHSKGILQAISNEVGTEIILESTANGIGNYFHSRWLTAMTSQSEYQAIFLPWYWQDEYTANAENLSYTEEEEHLNDMYGKNGLTKEHIAWRRIKIAEFSKDFDAGKDFFSTEYPFCIVGSQRIGTDYGILPIDAIITGHKTSIGLIKNHWFKGMKETVYFETLLGYGLECTPDHKVLCCNNEFREAQDLLNHSIILSSPQFSVQSNIIVKFNPFPCVSSYIEINEKLALFLGFFMGDGSYHGDTLSIVCDRRDESSINIIVKLFIELFDKHPEIRKVSENGIEIRTNAKFVKQMFFALNIIEKKTYGIKRKVCVPDCIWRSSIVIIKEFLKGLFDSDGFAHRNNAGVGFFSKYPSFCKDIQLLLLGFGITCKRTHERKKAGDGHFYMGNKIHLRGDEARLFSNKIGFVSNRKCERTKSWTVRKGSGRPSFGISFEDKVISIKSLGIQSVYDIEIDENSHVFDAQGILVHNCAVEAFKNPVHNVFIASKYVDKARKADIDSHGALIIGVDVAISDRDRTAIIRRKGRRAYNLERLGNHNTMEICGRLKRIIMEEHPEKVYIDCIGIGAGVVDRMQEMGFNMVEGVNVARSANDKEKFKNLRAELWSDMRDWLYGELPVQIPDENELHGELCSLGFKENSSGQIQIESKDDLRARGMPSPDGADALSLSFFGGFYGVANAQIEVPQMSDYERAMFR